MPNHIIGAAVNGVIAIRAALTQDPDTRYQRVVGSGPATTMRQLAASVASLANTGGVCAESAQMVQTTLNGLPS